MDVPAAGSEQIEDSKDTEEKRNPTEEFLSLTEVQKILLSFSFLLYSSQSLHYMLSDKPVYNHVRHSLLYTLALLQVVL